jgi:DNA-binding MarR family transcriptional regulator
MLSEAAHLVLERVSRTIEESPGETFPRLRERAGVSRLVGNAALDRLVSAGFVERSRVAGEWRYRSVTSYRSRVASLRIDDEGAR